MVARWICMLGGLLSLLSASIGVSAKELYVDGTRGNDSVTYEANSASNPWRTLGRAVWGSSNRNSPNSSQAARAGDVVIVAAGVYDTTATTGERYLPIYNPVNSGTASNPIVIKAAEGATVELRASNGGGPGQPIIGTYSRDWVVWDGFYLDERYILTRGDTGPVVVWESDHVTIQNLTIRGYSRGWTDNHNGIRLEFTDHILLRNNLISGYGGGMNDSGIMLYRTRTAIIEHNEISDAGSGVFVKGLVEGPITIRNNLISDASYGILFGGIGTSSTRNGAVVHNNIITDIGAGVAFIGYDSYSPANVDVVNNTIVNARGTDGGAILFRPGYSGYNDIRIFNNLLANSNSAFTAWEAQLGQISSNYNGFYQNSAAANVEFRNYSLAEWRSRYGKDSNSVEGSPGWQTASYIPGANSVFANAGLDILDLDGDGSTTDRVNIGAYVTGNEVVGRTASAGPIPRGESPPNPPQALVVN